PIHLHVFGAGSDALPLLRLADELGWKLTLWDNRKLYMENSARVLGKGVSIRFVQGQPEKIGEWFRVSPKSAIVVMTHHFGKDQKILAELSKFKLPYLGVLGPLKRGQVLMNALKSENRLPLKKWKSLRASLHSPVGLDLGSETPEEIALSIVSEIQSHFTDAGGKALSGF
ncbi:MAG: XdhC family protein, partial [Spirochaetia bacterium]|nr:XdhC family protein [Spirochaetia bacterium]